MKILALLFVTAVCAKHEIYTGWKSYSVKPVTHIQVERLYSKVPEFDLDFLSHGRLGREGIVLVKPQYQTGFLQFLSEENIQYGIHCNDLKSQFDLEDHQIEATRRLARSANEDRLPYNNYQTLDVIYEYIDNIALQYPEIVTLVQNMTSFEGRPLKYLKISKDNFESNKPVIYIDAAMNARDWISVPTVTYALHKLVENVSEPDLLDNFDWILFPVVNPDGYEFTFNGQRLWRKTRSTDQTKLSVMCPGVDGNRNFDFMWHTFDTSDNPCHDIYPGTRAFSEVETRTVDDIINEHLDKMILFITMHSYGSYILYPWGHDGSLSEYGDELQDVGNRMAEAIDRMSLSNFPNYTVGNSAQVIDYAKSGAAEDYAHQRGVKLAYSFELPGLNTGFLLDTIYVRQVCEETWAGLVAGARRAGELFGK